MWQIYHKDVMDVLMAEMEAADELSFRTTASIMDNFVRTRDQIEETRASLRRVSQTIKAEIGRKVQVFTGMIRNKTGIKVSLEQEKTNIVAL